MPATGRVVARMARSYSFNRPTSRNRKKPP
ncbi:hypothetical protein SAMN05216193_10363 [Pseudomonas jinjuensis]|uniref:Uncharacterized protein n=1 Tax=Pseudomonas jinjuensis TaxID=198616 RepID=A0A1H0BGQ0_9PSED|nr:hypothetical protein SAMN05216193_10363 [Pseudomonas jinjuensis]